MTDFLKERITLKISLTFVVILMIWGLVFNELTESNIVELDASSYVISGIVGLVTIYVSRLQERPGTDTHPLGYSGFVPILNLIRNLMIVLIAIKAIGESIGSIVSGPPAPEHGILFLYASVTLVINISSALYIHRTANKIHSSLLKTDALEWRIDTVSNISILAAFALAYLLDLYGFSQTAAYVDPVVCIFFSIFMCVDPVKLFVENMQLLSISSIDKNSQELLIQKMRTSAPLLESMDTHFTIVTIAGMLWVNIEIKARPHKKIELEELLDATATCQKILDEINPKNKLSYQYLSDRSIQQSPLSWGELKENLTK